MNRLLLYFLLVGLLLGTRVEAVIVAGGDGSQNTSSPSGGQGWDYVGKIDKANVYSSVTYISNNWFITAHHIKVLDNPTSVLLGGSPYLIDPNSWTRLANSESGNADLSMFRVVGGTVGLPGLTVRSSATANGSDLTMIGNGRNRQSSETTWNSSWVEGGKPTAYRGYKWASDSAKRWGTNLKDADVGLINSGENFGITDMFSTDFDKTGGTTDEAQGATYDSGGGVFLNNGGDWELTGIMLLTPVYNGQPGSTAVYGNLTYMADMRYYAAQISSTAQIIDIDEDGIPDNWEYEQTGSTTGVVASADQDDDGFTGEEEWIADTDPTNSASHFQILDWQAPTNVTFSSSAARRYLIESRADLVDTNETWQTEVDWFDGSSPQTAKAVSSATSNRFYRIRAKLP